MALGIHLSITLGCFTDIGAIIWLGQSHDYLRVSEATLQKRGKYMTVIYYELVM